MSAPAERPAPEPGHPPADRFRQLAEWAPVGIVESDSTGLITFVNDRWRQITGCDDPTPIPYERVSALLHPDDRDGVQALYRRSVLEQGEFDAGARLVRPDGSVRHVRLQGSTVFDGDTRIGYVGSVMDLTDVVEADLARQRSEQRYRDLIASAPVGQAVYNLRGTLIEVNRSWANLLGYEPDEVIGTKAHTYVHPDDRERILSVTPALLDGEVDHIQQERRLLHKDGSTVWVSSSITLERDPEGKPALFHSLIIDITERMRAVQALRQNEARYRAVIDSLHDGIIIHTDDDVLAANASVERILGIDPDTVLDAPSLARLDVLDSDGVSVPLDQRPSVWAFRDGKPRYDVIQGIRTTDGGIRWFLTNTVPLFEDDADAQPYAVALSFTDITDRKNAMDALRESEIKFRTLAESLPVGVFHADVRGRFDYANPRWLEITDVTLDELDDPHTLDIIHPDDRQRLWGELTGSLRDHRPYHVQYRIRTKDGATRWLSGRGSNTFDPETGEPTGLVGSIEDITPLVAAQEETVRLAGIVESTSDLVGIVDYDSEGIIYLNRAARELFGFGSGDLGEATSSDIFAAAAAPVVEAEVIPALERDEVWSGELPMRAADGSTVLVWQTIAAERRSDGSIHQLAAVGRDVTERRQAEAELAYRATHDALTGLPNRTLLLDHLELGLARARRDGKLVALLFGDLDRFKQVNDSLGHEAGDELLAQVARRIADVLRPADTVARLGGDEFVVLAEDVDDENHAVTIAQRVLVAIESGPFRLAGTEIEATASIGIAISGGDAHPEALLRDADAAMYRAKDLGRARLEVFDESMRARAARRNELANELATGIETDHIAVHYQPCVNLTTGKITSVEALARWEHPDRGILSPYEFIALAEETGLIVGLGLSVLSKACRQARDWEVRFGLDAPSVHVNLSARQLTATNLPALVAGVLQGSRLSPNKLCLEITESVLMDDAPAVIDTLWALKGIGVSIAIDDFGTGYSSLSYLRRFPVDVLKVDQSFVDGLGPDPEDSAIVAAIVNLATTLELDAVAEGVETREQLERLRALGCNGAQGFYFAEPRPADEIEALFGAAFEV